MVFPFRVVGQPFHVLVTREPRRRQLAPRSRCREELVSRAGLSTHAISSLERGERRQPYPYTARRSRKPVAKACRSLTKLSSGSKAMPNPPATSSVAKPWATLLRPRAACTASSPESP